MGNVGKKGLIKSEIVPFNCPVFIKNIAQKSGRVVDRALFLETFASPSKGKRYIPVLREVTHLLKVDVKRMLYKLGIVKSDDKILNIQTNEVIEKTKGAFGTTKIHIKYQLISTGHWYYGLTIFIDRDGFVRLGLVRESSIFRDWLRSNGYDINGWIQNGLALSRSNKNFQIERHPRFRK